jgi:hypothetical protein
LGHGHTGIGQFLCTFVGFLAIFFLGQSLVKRGAGAMLLGSLVAAAFFHVFTSSMAWAVDPRYIKSATGLWHSIWAGAPGDPLPSWVFLRNLSAANLLFTGAVILAGRTLTVWPKSLRIGQAVLANP